MRFHRCDAEAVCDAMYLHRAKPDMHAAKASLGQHLLQLRDGPQPPMILEGSPEVLHINKGSLCRDDQWGMLYWVASSCPANASADPVRLI